MNYTNCNFPLIKYTSNDNHYNWGNSHGEEFRTAINELVEIRKQLMLSKNPNLRSNLDSLANEQFEITKSFSPEIAQEIKGISKGANCSLTDIVILNNYTDFRDIVLPDEGCSTIHIQNSTNVIAGQTWDMHRSAKNYMCMIQIPLTDTTISQVILSLVGCVGLMGVNSYNCMIGVNNINTTNAKIGMIWPALVRKVLTCKSLQQMRTVLFSAPVTSGHNYLISSIEGGEHLEITPSIIESVSSLTKGQTGAIFHTNHCLGHEIQKFEDKNSLSSTTFNRFELLTKKTEAINNILDLKDMLSDHEEFPKSICSHFENGAQDPSFTCGGGACDLTNKKFIFWRGCHKFDTDYKEIKFQLQENEFFIQ